jgi:hypothetical protein
MADITTADAAAELATDPRTLRKFLRADARARGVETPGKGARWALKGDARSLAAMKKRFIAWQAEQAETDNTSESD